MDTRHHPQHQDKSTTPSRTSASPSRMSSSPSRKSASPSRMSASPSQKSASLHGTSAPLYRFSANFELRIIVSQNYQNLQKQGLFLALYKNLGDVLKERLPTVSADGKMPNLKAGQADSMAVDTEEPPAMEVDQENGKNNSQTNGERLANTYNIGEQEQWCLTTLGYVKAFSRQYATEIWPHIEMLDAEVFVEDVHPLFRKAAYIGLCRNG